MTLKKDGENTLKSELASWPDGIKARKENRFTTAWRTIQIAPQAVGLINSSLILNLNEPCKLDTTDWIKPMKYVGVWWGMHLGVETWKMDDRHGATTANAKKYIDLLMPITSKVCCLRGGTKDGKVGEVCRVLTLLNLMPTLIWMK